MREGSMAAGGQVGAEHTYRRARGTLETREATVTLYASVTLFACLTLVTTWALRSLEKGGDRLSMEGPLALSGVQSTS